MATSSSNGARNNTELDVLPSRFPEESMSLVSDLTLKCLLRNWSASIKQKLSLRLVCKEWDKIIGEDANVMENTSLTISGEFPSSVEALSKLSRNLKMRKLEISKVDLRELLEDPETFCEISKFHCPCLESLTLMKCWICTGRFVETLAFCSNLKALAVLHCPEIFDPSMGFFHWGFCFDALKKNLAGITKLTVREAELSDEDLWALAGLMKNLESLHVYVGELAILPRVAICNILKNNAKTLNTLILGGTLFEDCNWNSMDVELLQGVPQMANLNALRLSKGCYMTIDHSGFLEAFLSKCPNVSELCLSNARLTRESFSTIECGLLYLDLTNCVCTEDVQHCKFRNLYRLKINQVNEPMDYGETADSAIYLLKSQTPLLQILKLFGIPHAVACLEVITAVGFPELTELNLNLLLDINGAPLRKLLENFPGLQALTLRHCSVFDDEGFIEHSLLFGEIGCIESLKDLNYLDLSDTDVGDRSISEVIVKLPALQELLLDLTTVTNEGVQTIVNCVAVNELPLLRFLSVRKAFCDLSTEQIFEFNEMAPQLQIHHFNID